MSELIAGYANYASTESLLQEHSEAGHWTEWTLWFTVTMSVTPTTSY
ncbi:hypothetical protein GT755_21495 [Herbidospora sp. NEAU-GS84]|uniref:Uncharacterized protein n=1 Tax=Herbidospora solisilvae TaxID=2696284 RepID=A0A7C9NIW5_9ACTN|nr:MULTISPECIES: hypothetical protein [Herbidospora]NAS24258.1 hypothetical protein [Herbidospora solisilvae]GLX98304.1 hypothetical protein Hesp01_62540 [Herbidospora sp. NBRC 101105]